MAKKPVLNRDNPSLNFLSEAAEPVQQPEEDQSRGADQPEKVPAKQKVLKDKTVSLKVNSDAWADFRRICDTYGVTANSMVNQLINRYIIEQKKELGL